MALVDSIILYNNAIFIKVYLFYTRSYFRIILAMIEIIAIILAVILLILDYLVFGRS